MRIGDIEVTAIVDGECRAAPERLYGGGTPPTSSSWAAYADDHDPHGRAVMSVGSYLIRAGKRLVLCDTGFGPRHFGAFYTGALHSSLLRIGVRPTDITDVVYSHLHVDHIGWTSIEGTAFFPNAEHWVDARDWHHYTAPGIEIAAWEVAMIAPVFGSVAEQFAPVADRVRTFQPGEELVPGIRALDAAGHSPGSTVFELASGGERGYLIGDLAHTVGELLDDHWRLGFHSHGGQASAAIEGYRRLLSDSGDPFAAAHFPGMRWGRLGSGPGGLRYEQL